MSRFYRYFEQNYALRNGKPYFLNLILFRQKLSNDQLNILRTKFSFFKKLNDKEKEIFKHRLAAFIKSKNFVARENLQITDEMKVLISATAVMLTFGFRNYKIKIIDHIVVYPMAFYSYSNKVYHKGETNPNLKTVVFSWEDFLQGYEIGNDNLNLGIHEFGHAIHLNAMSRGDVSSLIFIEGFKELTTYLQNHQEIRQDLLQSKYFRAYAFTNQYEFFAVLLENFIETPREFKSQFPHLYQYLKQMLNFNFGGY
ncbi:zinc-dependent peptidase [Winogradskyella ursingii]|uniref:zinc-dependent peptidase n=1 Tax=Winogradskyella ursingii TaxID=2686079 RepID=UPI001FE3F56F|nr:zinc-dependent peptidase [Winogradskyella ursingii]